MEIKKALKVREAFLVLAEVLEITPEEVAGHVCLLISDKQHKTLLEAQDLWMKFADCDLVERGKMLGITVTLCEEAQGG